MINSKNTEFALRYLEIPMAEFNQDENLSSIETIVLKSHNGMQAELEYKRNFWILKETILLIA